MSAITSPAPPAQQQPRPAVPAGAAKLQNWYVDHRGRHVDSPHPVPVDKDNRRTKHALGKCPQADCRHTDWVPENGKRHCPEHGGKLSTSGDRGTGRAERREALAREILVLHGASALPWAALAVVAVAGLAGWLGHLPPLYVAAAAPVLYGIGFAVALWLLWREAIRLERVQPGQRAGKAVRRVRADARRIGGHAALATVWVAAASWAGPPAGDLGQIVWAALIAGWAARAYPWWRQVDARRSRGTVPPKPAAQITATPATDPIVAWATTTWASRIGQPGGPLAGTELVDVAKLPAVTAGGPDRPRRPNFRATVVAVQNGSINMRESRPNLVGRIAAAFRGSVGDVTFAADRADQSIAYLRVQPDNPLAEVRMYPGPDPGDWRRGWSQVGWFDDGSPMIYLWWSEIGATQTLISGCTGSGKSELVAQLMLRSLHSGGLVVDWLGDPQGGQSYGHVKDLVDWFAPDLSEIKLMLLAAVKEMYRRSTVLSSQYVKTWRPTREMPLLVITLDEVQSYIEDAVIAELVEKLVGQGRKAGIGMRLLTQIPAAYALGGTGYIKEQLKAGQSFTFRAATEMAGRLAADGSDGFIDPALLPDRWGRYTCGEDKTTAGLCFVQGARRSDLFGRVAYTGEDMAIWLYHNGQPTISPGQFGPEAQTHSGVLWAGRRDRAALALTAGHSDDDLLRAGSATELIRQAEVLASVGYDRSRLVTSANASGAPPAARDVVHAAAELAASKTEDRLATRPAIIAATPGMAGSTRDNALSDLVADGALDRVKPGYFKVLRPAPAGALPAAAAAQPTPPEKDPVGSYVASVLTGTFLGATMTIFDIQRAFAEPGWPFDRAAVEAKLAELVAAGTAEWVAEDEGWRATAKFRSEVVDQLDLPDSPSGE